MTQAQASSGQPAAATLGAFIAQSRFADVPAAGHARSETLGPQFRRHLPRRAARSGRAAAHRRAAALLGQARGGGDRAARSPRHAQCGAGQCGRRQHARVRRHASADRDPPHGPGAAADPGAGRPSADFRQGPAARVRARRRCRLPGRQFGNARPLCARLAHHGDLRDLRCRRSQRSPAWLGCRADRARARHRREPGVGHRREPADRRQEHRHRQLGPQRPAGCHPGRQGIHGSAARHRRPAGLCQGGGRHGRSQRADG